MRSLKMILALAAGPLAFGLLPTQASAQVFMQQNAPGQIGTYNPPRTGLGGPAYNPYNNINRPGGAASNYFGTIRPQMDAMRAFNQIQQNQAGAVGPGPAEDAYYPGGQGQFYKDPASQLQTGHPVAFGNTAQYFPSQTGTRGVNGAGGNGIIGARPGVYNQPFGAGAAIVNGNVYGGVINTPNQNQSILIGPNGPAVINRLP
jgi:hypothetical protein